MMHMCTSMCMHAHAHTYTWTYLSMQALMCCMHVHILKISFHRHKHFSNKKDMHSVGLSHYNHTFTQLDSTKHQDVTYNTLSTLIPCSCGKKTKDPLSVLQVNRLTYYIQCSLWTYNSEGCYDMTLCLIFFFFFLGGGGGGQFAF